MYGHVPCDFGMSKRTLRRDHTPTGAIVVEDHLCIKGGMSEEWSVLPIETQLGQSCVRVTTYGAPWLYQLCFGSKTPDTVMNNVVNWTIDHCRDLVKRAADIEEPEPVVEETISDAALSVLMDSDCESLWGEYTGVNTLE